MKRIIALTLALLLILTLASCGKKEAEPTEATQITSEPTETTTPAPTEPEGVPAIIRAGYAEALFSTYEKGTELKVLGQFKDYFVVEGEEVDLLVERRFLRLSTEEPFKPWDGYARGGAKVFESVYMRGEPIEKLKVNTRVNVLEGKGDWLYIEWNDGENKGYVDVDDISKHPISYGGGGGGGGSAAPADGTDVPLDSLAVTDFNAELTLLGAYYGPEKEADFQEDMGIILAEDIEGYIRLGLRGDEVKVTEYDETIVMPDEDAENFEEELEKYLQAYCTIYIGDGYYAQLPRWILFFEGDAEYETWTGYSKWNYSVYEEYQMRNKVKTPNLNTEILVLAELPTCYVVEWDGEIYYMSLDGISTTRIVGGGGGGGNTGGGGEAWTPPQL